MRFDGVHPLPYMVKLTCNEYGTPILIIHNIKRRSQYMKLFRKVLSVVAVLSLVVMAIPARAKAAADVVDFEDGNMAGFAVNTGADGSVDGDPFLMSVVDYNGSKMLKIDNQTGNIPKLVIDVIALVGGDNIDKIRKVDMDLIAVNPDSTKTTNWCGGGIGANYGPDGKTWYQDDTQQYSANDNGTSISDTMKPGLAFIDGFGFTNNAAGSKFLLQFWGNDKTCDLYIDNVTFYDADGNKIPLATTAAATSTDTAASTDVPKTGVVGLGIVYGLGAVATGAVAMKRRNK